MSNTCMCGCGKEVKKGRLYIHGHNGRGTPRLESTKRKIAMAHNGTHHSKGTKLKMSLSHIGKTRSMESRLKQAKSISGSKNHFFGKHHTLKTKEKIKLNCIGKQAGIKNSFYGKHHTPESKEKNAEKHRGDKSSGWRGGVSFKPYCPKFNNKLKKAIRNRDNRTCQLCGTKENGRQLDVHHIHYDKENCTPDLIALCQGCNSKANYNQNYYEKLFMNNLNNRNLLYWLMGGR